MKIAIYGAGKCGEYVLSEISRCKDSKIEIIAIIDNNPAYTGKSKYDIPIFDLKGFADGCSKNVDGVLITAWDELKAQEMAVSLLNVGYDDIYFIPEVVSSGKLPVLNRSGKLFSYIRHIKLCKPILPYVEYHVSDYCNLKYRGCGHFSNLVKDKVFPDIGEFRDSLEGLVKRFSEVKKFRLMGGEPLTNPDLGLFVYETRKAFPYSDIRIVTNGLLLPQLDKKTAEVIRACGAVIDISQYPPTRDMIEKIIQYTHGEGLKVQIGLEITKFMKMVGGGCDIDARQVYSKCMSNHCHFLRKNRLYVCGAPILFFENKDFLGLNVKKSEVEDCSFDLIDGKEDGWQIMRKLLVPFDFCKYCAEPEWFDWKILGKEIKREDWIVQ